MNGVLALPTGPLADASLSIAQTSENAPIADHSIRSFLFARLLAEHEGRLDDAAYDEELLFAACVMHDLGLGTRGSVTRCARCSAMAWSGWTRTSRIDAA